MKRILEYSLLIACAGLATYCNDEADTTTSIVQSTGFVAPSVDAGDAIEAQWNESIALEGTETAGDADIVARYWIQVAGAPGHFDDNGTLSVVFHPAHPTDCSNTYTLRLVAIDANGLMATDDVTVSLTADNITTPPLAMYDPYGTIVDGNDNLWVIDTYIGLHRFEEGHWQSVALGEGVPNVWIDGDSPGYEYVYNMGNDPTTQDLWVWVTDRGLARRNAATGKWDDFSGDFAELPADTSVNYYAPLLVDTNGDVWIINDSDDYRVLRFALSDDETSGEYFDYHLTPSDGDTAYASGIVQDAAHNVWISFVGDNDEHNRIVRMTQVEGDWESHAYAIRIDTGDNSVDEDDDTPTAFINVAVGNDGAVYFDSADGLLIHHADDTWSAITNAADAFTLALDEPAEFRTAVDKNGWVWRSDDDYLEYVGSGAWDILWPIYSVESVLRAPDGNIWVTGTDSEYTFIAQKICVDQYYIAD